MNEHAEKIAEIIRRHDHFIIASHTSPDGDALGSLGAMGFVLAAQGKTFALYNGSGIPERLNWLPLPDVLYKDPHTLPFTPQTAISLDCGDGTRLGDKMHKLLPGLDSINIDHHLGNPNFGTLYNWVDPSKAAVGQMVAEVAKALGVKLHGGLAECVYTALVSDTGAFGFSNTSADVFRLAAELVENGLDVSTVRDKIDKNWTLPKMRLWSKLQERFEISEDGLVAYATLDKADLESVGAIKENLEGFVEHLRLLRGIAVSLLIYGENKNRCKASLRSTGNIDVCSVARRFGGGGHRNAAGALMDMPADEAMEKMLKDLHDNLLDLSGHSR